MSLIFKDPIREKNECCICLSTCVPFFELKNEDDTMVRVRCRRCAALICLQCLMDYEDLVCPTCKFEDDITDDIEYPWCSSICPVCFEVIFRAGIRTEGLPVESASYVELYIKKSGKVQGTTLLHLNCMFEIGKTRKSILRRFYKSKISFFKPSKFTLSKENDVKLIFFSNKSSNDLFRFYKKYNKTIYM